MDVYIASIMTPEVVTIEPHKDIEQAVGQMNENNVNSVLVADDEYTGIFTTGDLICAVSKKDKPIEEIPVKECATEDPVTINPDTELDEAIEILFDRNFHHVPVESDSEICGMVSTSDINNYVYLEAES